MASTKSEEAVPQKQPLYNIETPHNNDVLCGRGVSTNQWEGNLQFRSLVSCNKELYVTSTKRQKMHISKSIVDAVRSMDPPGRFLEKDPVTGLWSDIGEKKATEKTSQALRDGAAQLRKQLSADLHDPDFLNAVFDVDGGGNSSEGKDADKVKPEKKEKSSKKVRAVKKGHRRVKSNPDSLVGNRKKVRPKRMMRAFDYPSSPRPTRTLSQPASPMVFRSTASPFPERIYMSPTSMMYPVQVDDSFHERMGEGPLFRNHSFDTPRSPVGWAPPMSPLGRFHTRFGPIFHPPVSPMHPGAPGFAVIHSGKSPRSYWNRPPISPARSWSMPGDHGVRYLQSPCSPASTSALMSHRSTIDGIPSPPLTRSEELSVPMLHSRVSSPPGPPLSPTPNPSTSRDFTPPMSPVEAKKRDKPKTLTPTPLETGDKNDENAGEESKATFVGMASCFDGKNIIDSGNDGIEVIFHERSGCESPMLGDDSKILSADDTSSTSILSEGTMTPLPFDGDEEGFGDDTLLAMDISDDFL